MFFFKFLFAFLNQTFHGLQSTPRRILAYMYTIWWIWENSGSPRTGKPSSNACRSRGTHSVRWFFYNHKLHVQACKMKLINVKFRTGSRIIQAFKTRATIAWLSSVLNLWIFIFQKNVLFKNVSLFQNISETFI